MADAIGTTSRDIWTQALSRTPYATKTAWSDEDSKATEQAGAAAVTGAASTVALSASGQAEATLQGIEQKVAAAGKALGLSPDKDGNYDFTGSLRKAVIALGDQLNSILSRSRIPVDGNISVYKAADGSLKVRGEPRMKELIEKAINEDSSFKENFDKTSSIAKADSLSKIAEAARRWKKAYPAKEKEIEKWAQRAAENVQNASFQLDLGRSGATGALVNGDGNPIGIDQPGALGVPLI